MMPTANGLIKTAFRNVWKGSLTKKFVTIFVAAMFLVLSPMLLGWSPIPRILLVFLFMVMVYRLITGGGRRRGR